MSCADLQENFESDLAGWSDRVTGSPDATIVADPFNAANHVLAFTTLRGAGSLFSAPVKSDTGGFTLSFDYLGLARAGSVAGDLGGYIGVTQGRNSPNGFWVGGTGAYATPVSLLDDGQWHTYSTSFASPVGSVGRVMVEDWDGSHGVGRDAMFDNIRLQGVNVAEVPEPGTLALAAAGLLGAGCSRRVRRAARG